MLKLFIPDDLMVKKSFVPSFCGVNTFGTKRLSFNKTGTVLDMVSEQPASFVTKREVL
jgi:hypothetical protein